MSGVPRIAESAVPRRVEEQTVAKASRQESRSDRGRSRFRRPMVLRIVVANAVLAVAAGCGSAVVMTVSGGDPTPLLAAVLATAILAAVALNLLLLGPAGKLLGDLAGAMQNAHRGEMDCRVRDDWRDPDLRRLSASFNEMCRRLGNESLSYAGRQLGGVEEERRRIGRELHDETSQTLTATLVRLDLCDKAVQDHDAAEAHRQVVNCKELIGHTIEEIKLLVYDLRPVMLDDFGLVPTLRWYIQSHMHGVGPAIVTDFDEADLRLPGDVETALYRIAQEALANAVRHASATKIYVRLVTKPGFVSLAVIDNGVGFEPDTTLRGDDRRGVGLVSVRERVELVGGTVNVESAIGRGTRLYVVIPLDGDGAGEERR